MKIVSLNGKWKLYFYDGRKVKIDNPSELPGKDVEQVDCMVPGNVELDLSKAGYLPEDLFFGENILEAEKYEPYEWWYQCEFDTCEVQEGEKVTVRFHGIDCIAQYWLNGEIIGHSSNMFIPFEFEITDKLIDRGKNMLYVKISSAMAEAVKIQFSSFSVYNAYGHKPDSVHIRKAPHSFGWDIMPRAVSAGIWRDVELVIKGPCEIEELFYHIYNISEEYVDIRFVYVLDSDLITRYDGYEVEISGQCGDSTFFIRQPVDFNSGRLNVRLKNPKLWWPHGYGEANLYEVKMSVLRHGKTVAERKLNMGIRTVKLVRTDLTDGESGCFKFLINDTEIMCKGTNWVPLDAYHSQDIYRYDKALDLLKDIGCNIVRCWGGNVYEQQKFYDFCDENGIMIWQDFAMACHIYPQDKAFADAISAEVTAVIKQYRNHPALILWSGDNECDMMAFRAGINPDQNYVTREIIPRLIESYDKNRPYLPSSPYINSLSFAQGDYLNVSEDHLWGPRDYYKSKFYTGSKAHFVSETGYHGCPARKSIEKFIHPDFVWPYKNNRQWNLHSTTQDNNDGRVMLMDKQVRQLFGEVPDNLDDYALASQISQAEAKKFFIENMRNRRPIKTGVLWWNLLDGWPQMSDAVVDYYFEKKLAYHYIKRSQQPFYIAIGEIVNWGVNVIASNDTLSTMKGSFTVTDADSGTIMLQGEFTVEKNQNKVLGFIPVMFSDKKLFLIQWNANGKEGKNHYLCGMVPFSFDQYKHWLKKIM